jgi:hypothetical protein
MVWNTDAITAKTYLFSRNYETSELTYIGIDQSHKLGTFTRNNTICAQQNEFKMSRTPFQDFHVIELEDYLNQRNNSVGWLFPNQTFLLVNSTGSITWNSSTNGNVTEFWGGKPEIVNVCHRDDFILLPYTSFDMSLVPKIFSGLAAASAGVAMLIYIYRLIVKGRSKIFDVAWYHDMAWYLFWSLLMFFYLLFSVTTFTMVEFKLREAIAGILVVANWTIRILIIIISIFILFRTLEDNIPLDKNEVADPNPEKIQRVKIMLVVCGFLILSIVVALSLFIGIFKPDYIGLDNASIQTGYAYVNALNGPPATIRNRFLIM